MARLHAQDTGDADTGAEPPRPVPAAPVSCAYPEAAGDGALTLEQVGTAAGSFLVVAGLLDLSTTEPLTAALARLAATGQRTGISLRHVHFADTAGLAPVVAAIRRTAGDPHRALRITSASHPVRRVFAYLDVTWQPTVDVSAWDAAGSRGLRAWSTEVEFSSGPETPDAQVGTATSAPAATDVACTDRNCRTKIAGLQQAMLSNRRIGIAVGILMALRGVDAEQAFNALTRASQNSNRKVRDLAEDVIYTGALPASPAQRRAGRAPDAPPRR